jgi:predicted outer membrane protein
MRFTSILLVAAVAGGAIFAVSAQQDPNAPKPGSQQKPRTDGQGGDHAARGSQRDDGILATWILVDNGNEIALAKLAQERAQSPEVKQFAQMMVAEHGKLGQKLQPFAAKVGFTGTTRTDGRDTNGRDTSGRDTSGRDTDGRDTDGRDTDGGDASKNGNDPQDPPRDSSKPQDPTGRNAGAGGNDKGGLDHVALLQELGSKCLDSGRKELEKKSGAEFDRCFMGMMIGAHMKANDVATVFERHASGELKSVLAEGRKTTETHLAKAKEIAKQLERGDSAAPKQGG